MDKFNQLSKQELEWLTVIFKDKRIPSTEKRLQIAERFDIHLRTVSRWKVRLNLTKEKEECNVLKEAGGKKLQKKKVYLISWAQNATPVNASFIKNMETYAEFRDAEILIIPGRYKNPTSVWSKDQDTEEWWTTEVIPYLYANREDFHKDVTIVGDLKIQPTAVNPLSGLEALTGDTSSIFGHPRVHLTVLPALEGHTKKMMLTTGACTIRNYTDSKRGKKGEFHHTYGFSVLEVDEDNYYVRQVTANEFGTFTDLYFKVKNQQVTRIDTIAAYVAGDIHERWLDKPVFEKKLELMSKLRPENLVLHDVFDGDSVNHHEEKDPIKKYQRYSTNRHVLADEIKSLIKFMSKVVKYNTTVISSNHDNFLDRWISNMDWKRDIPNAPEYMFYAGVLLKGEAPKGLIPYILDKAFDGKINCLGIDESFKVIDIELAHHGHMGSNGSRGGLTQFVKLNTKMVTAHTHSPARRDGVLIAGTSTILRPDYVKGASNWMNSDVILHTDGKLQHIFWMSDMKCTNYEV